VCALAAVAMNLLRLIGQHTLHEPDSPVRHSAQRRRVRTVIQEGTSKNLPRREAAPANATIPP
jgi:hypothetical protein